MKKINNQEVAKEAKIKVTLHCQANYYMGESDKEIKEIYFNPYFQRLVKYFNSTLKVQGSYNGHESTPDNWEIGRFDFALTFTGVCTNSKKYTLEEMIKAVVEHIIYMTTSEECYIVQQELCNCTLMGVSVLVDKIKERA